MKRILPALMLITALFSSPVHAQIPTIDPASIQNQIQQLRQMLADYDIQVEHLDQLESMVEQGQKYLTELESLEASLTEARNVADIIMGGDLDKILELDFDNLGSIIGDISSGDWSSATDAMRPQTRSKIEEALRSAGYDTATVTRIENEGTPEEQRNVERAATSATISAAAEQSYEDAGRSLERVTTLVESIDAQETLLEAVNHNTRVTAELAILLTKALELEAVQTVGGGNIGVTDAATLAEEDAFSDIVLPSFE